MASFKPLTKAERKALKEKSNKNKKQTQRDRVAYGFRRARLREEIEGIEGSQNLDI